MRIRFLAVHQTAAALLLFQATAFLVPWFIVLWLSFSEDVEAVAQYSFLLAIFSPIALLCASPSRNYLLSSEHLSDEQVIGIRLLLCAIGVLLALSLGSVYGAVTLAVAICLAKSTEFFFDLPIAKNIKSKQSGRLAWLAVLKIIVIAVGALVVLTFDNLPFALTILSIGFVAVSWWQFGVRAKKPANLGNTFKSIIPLSMSALVFSVYFNIPRYLLGGQEESGLLAILTISSFLLTALLVLNNALCQAQLHNWSKLISLNDAVGLKRSVYKGLARSLAMYVLLQVWQLPLLFDGFWAAHNNLQLQDPNYPDIFRWFLILAFGPLLFSFSNYLLTVNKEHQLLLKVTVINTSLTGIIAWLTFSYIGIFGLLALISLSGVSHSIFCFWRFNYTMKRLA